MRCMRKSQNESVKNVVLGKISQETKPPDPNPNPNPKLTLTITFGEGFFPRGGGFLTPKKHNHKINYESLSSKVYDSFILRRISEHLFQRKHQYSGWKNQFVIFKLLSCCLEEIIGFGVKTSFASCQLSRLISWYNKPGDVTKEFWEKVIQFHGTFHGLQITNWNIKVKTNLQKIMSFSDHVEWKTFSEASCVYNLRTGGKSFSKMLLLKVCESFLYRHNTETWSAKVWICFEK